MKSLEEKVNSLIYIALTVAFVGLAVAWGLWKFSYTNNKKLPVKREFTKYLKVSTTTAPAGQSVLPKQRRKFAVEFGKKSQDKGMNLTVTTKGDFNTSIVIRSNAVSAALALGMKDNNETIKNLRDMGFKHMIITDGKHSWDVDLKN
jgi:hypothetical protein